MIVRPVEHGDAAEWLRLRHALFGDQEAVHAREIERFFAGVSREPEAVLVAEREGQLVGLAELSIRPYAEGCSSQNVGYLEGWFVEPEARGSGVGRALLSAAEAWAAARGCTEFASDAELGNEASRLAHTACGFEEVGQVRCFRKALTAVDSPSSIS